MLVADTGAGAMMRALSSRPRHPAGWRTKVRRAILIGLLVIAALAGVIANAARLDLLGSEPIRLFPARGHPAAISAVFLSGDMGFNFGLSGRVATAMAAHGVPVIGIVSPAAFAHHLTQAQAILVVEQAMRRALRHHENGRLVLMGESFGADVLATVAPRLPPALLAHVDAILLTVPAPDVYFRADPSGLAYLGRPDARPLAALRRLHRPPIICIYGAREPESLCPQLALTAARVMALPGDHYLNRDPDRLIAATLGSLHQIVPAVPDQPQT